MTKAASDKSSMNNNYEENGFILVESFYSNHEIKEIFTVVDKFHRLWIQENYDFYNEKAVNSAYLTGKKLLNSSDRARL